MKRKRQRWGREQRESGRNFLITVTVVYYGVECCKKGSRVLTEQFQYDNQLICSGQATFDIYNVFVFYVVIEQFHYGNKCAVQPYAGKHTLSCSNSCTYENIHRSLSLKDASAVHLI